MVGILLIIFIVIAILCYSVISTPINEATIEENEDYIITNWWREHEDDYDFKLDENNQLINKNELVRA